MTDDTAPSERTCEWCGSPMPSGARAVCPSCGRLASRLSVMEESELPPAGDDVLYGDDAVLAAAGASAPPPPPPTPPEPVAPPPPAAAPPKPPVAPPTKPPTKPPAKPAPAPTGGGGGDRDAPLPPGIAWPTPEPLPPDDSGRAWWKVAVPAAVVVVLIVVGLVFVLGGSGGSSDGDQAATPTTSKESVDISDLEDPADTEPRKTTTTETTTTTEATTTTVDPAGDRVAIDSGLGVEWTMAQKPDNLGVTNADGTGQLWTAQSDDFTTESVEIIDLGGKAFDTEAKINALVAQYGGKVGKIEDSHLAQVAGPTASFTGTVDGEPVVGYVVVVESADRGIVVSALRRSDDVEGLYLDWLPLPGSFTIDE